MTYTSNHFTTEFGIMGVYDMVESYNYMSSVYSPRYKNILKFYYEVLLIIFQTSQNLINYLVRTGYLIQHTMHLN